MRTYTENEIRLAWISMGDPWGTLYTGSMEKLISKLAEKDYSAITTPGFIDDDTITVRELREAWKRKYPDTALSVQPRVREADLQKFLQDIIDHREPEYPYASTWMDNNGVVWMRTSNKMWLMMGVSGKFPHNDPVRPLTRMQAAS